MTARVSMAGDGKIVRLTIFGEPVSAKNSRRLVVNKATGKRKFIKSAKALAYLDGLRMQVPIRRQLLTGELVIYANVFYGSERLDLDIALILDGLQNRIYKNDRQVREMHLNHFLDKAQPRTVIVIAHRPPTILQHCYPWE